VAERKKLGDLLLEAKIVDQQQLATALAHQKRWGGRLGEVLVILNFVSEDTLLKTLSKVLELPCVDLSKTKASPAAVKLVPIEMAKKCHVVPLGVKKESGKRVLFLAMSDPTNLSAIDEIQFHTGLTVKPVVATDSGISDAIRYYYDGIGFGDSTPPVSHASTTMMGSQEPQKYSEQEIKDASFSPKDRPSEERLSGDPAITARSLRALIELLKDKGVLTEEELREKLSRLFSGGQG